MSSQSKSSNPLRQLANSLRAKPKSMFVWLRHRVPALNWMLRGLLGALTHAEAPERTPFKSSTAEQLTLEARSSGR